MLQAPETDGTVQLDPGLLRLQPSDGEVPMTDRVEVIYSLGSHNPFLVMPVVSRSTDKALSFPVADNQK
jgi:hypothetical protein